MRVWISHSSEAEEFVRRLTAELRDHGVDVRKGFDSIRVGEPIARAIQEEIDAAEAVIIVVSSDTAKSLWVGSELALALSAGKRVLPILATPGAELPYFLRRLQYVDMSTPERFGLGITNILDTIDRFSGSVRDDEPPSGDLRIVRHLERQLEEEREAYKWHSLSRWSRLSSYVGATAAASAIVALVLAALVFEKQWEHYTAIVSFAIGVFSSILTALLVELYSHHRGSRAGDEPND